MTEWQRARLIPVSGIGSEQEAETRATSALLAVIEAVRDLSLAMFAPIGASRAQRAEVRCYTEVPLKLAAGKTNSRPDGLVQITYGKSTWTALLEVKTGSAQLTAEQGTATGTSPASKVSTPSSRSRTKSPPATASTRPKGLRSSRTARFRSATSHGLHSGPCAR